MPVSIKASATLIIHIWSNYRIHTTDIIVCTCTDLSGDMKPFVLVMYKFDGIPEHTILVRPHGNAKENKPYRRTMKSTKRQLEAELKIRKPKDAIDIVFESRGGLVGAHSAGELPRGRTQAYNMKRTLQQKEFEAGLGPRMPICSPSVTRDMLSSWSNVSMQRRSIDLFKMLHVPQSPWPFFVLTNNSWISTDSAVILSGFAFLVLTQPSTLVTLVLHPQSTDTSFWKTPKRHSHHCFWGLCLFTTISIFEVITTSFQRWLA